MVHQFYKYNTSAVEATRVQFI